MVSFREALTMIALIVLLLVVLLGVGDFIHWGW